MLRRQPHRRSTIMLAIAVTLIGAVAIAAATSWTISLAAGSKAQALTPAVTPPPTGVTATCVSSSADQVTVTWTAETGAKTYTVYYSTTGTSPWTSAGSVTAPTATWTSAASAIPNGSYYFAVTTTLTDTNWAASAQSSISAKRTLGTSSCA